LIKVEFLSTGNAEVPNPEENENFGKYSKFPSIPAGNFMTVDSRKFPGGPGPNMMVARRTLGVSITATLL